MPFPLSVDDATELRLMKPSQAETIFRVVDENREHLRRWLPWVDRTRSARDTREFIVSMERQYREGDGVAVGIWAGGRFAGAAGLRIERANRAASIGYWIARRYQGKGLVTRACRALMGWAFDELKLQRIELRAATGNRRSLAVARRLGFRREGVLRGSAWVGDRRLDMVVHGVLAAEWPDAGAARRTRR
jgi:ribosomal-protein-serine acetyltransferase